MTFRTRIFLVLLTLVALVEGATFFAVLNATRNNYVEQGRRELTLSKLLFDNALESRNRELAVAAGVLAGDFGFKRAAAGGDVPTIRSALLNHGTRINADVTFLVAADHSILTGSRQLPGLSDGDEFPFTDLLSNSRNTEHSVVKLQDRAMQLVAAPLYAPDLRGWLAFGFAIDDDFASQIRALTNLHVSFASSVPGSAGIVASTLDRSDRAALSDALSVPPVAGDEAIREVTVDTGDLLTLRSAIEGSHAQSVDVVLTMSMDEILRSYHSLRVKLTGILIVALILSAIGARLLSTTVSRPVLRLVAAARRISRGDYRHPVESNGDDVIGALATAFNDMQRDIQQRELQIVHQAKHDVLTGLPNRSLVNDRLAEAAKRSRRSGQSFSVMMLDLDGFKDINDTLGHATGDHVLVEVARRLLNIGRESDTVARLGGDEFLLLLEGTDSEQAMVTAERIIDAIGENIELPSMQIRTRLSIGIASYPQHGDTADELQRRADIAMYSAKGSDVSIAVYKPGQDEDHLRRLALVNGLRDALANDELELHYQPKMNVKTGRICSVEALVRWTHAEFGFVSPEEFVPLAEQSGHIRALTRSVLVKALSQLRDWRRQQIDIAVSINLSALDLLDEQLPDVVAQLLEEYGISSHSLTLEITESAVMKDAAYARGVMQRLRAQGIRLSIDDFGTGQSSLAQLKSLPVDELKIDKSFVLELSSSADDAAIVRSTIELGHNMGLTVTAEGVENTESEDMLKLFRCDEIQGFLLSRPLPHDQFATWFHDYALSVRGRGATGEAPNEDYADDTTLQAV